MLDFVRPEGNFSSEDVYLILLDSVMRFKACLDVLQKVLDDPKGLSRVAKLGHQPQRLYRAGKFPNEIVVVVPKLVEQLRDLAFSTIGRGGNFADDGEKPQVLGPDVHCQPRPEEIQCIVSRGGISGVNPVKDILEERVKLRMVGSQSVFDIRFQMMTLTARLSDGTACRSAKKRRVIYSQTADRERRKKDKAKRIASSGVFDKPQLERREKSAQASERSDQPC